METEVYAVGAIDNDTNELLHVVLFLDEPSQFEIESIEEELRYDVEIRPALEGREYRVRRLMEKEIKMFRGFVGEENFKFLVEQLADQGRMLH